ncbi:hypothetical protein CSKR_104580 [Clonorchis sinensis]|uniref:Uncharacterized protein n=1 Tax=Clonorchis sinensis TaxID=79923 RepID=A0A419PEA7_CLOSI|nr:hypothetical protein CSKR_104580 [Clonorchis sinensis]
MSPKKGETDRGLSKNFQQPYEYQEFVASSRVDAHTVKNNVAAIGDCTHLMSPKKGETGLGLSKNFQQPYDCLEAPQTRDSAGFQVSLSRNQMCLQMSVFLQFRAIWVQVGNKVDGNPGTAPT